MLAWLSGITALVAMTAPATTSELPLSIQVPAFLKALDFDRNLEIADATLVIRVVYDPNDPASVESKDRILAIQGQLTRLLVKGKRVVLEPMPYDPGQPVVGAGVLLATLLDATAVTELSRTAQSSGILTLATEPSDVERGIVLGLESRDGKPRFVVNLAAAEATGASFEAGFLNLCRIVER